MSIASFIVKTNEGTEESVAAAIASIDGLTVHSIAENKEIVVIAEAPTLNEVGALAMAIEAIENVLSVLMAYAGKETED